MHPLASSVAEGQRLGKYEIVRPLATGGMAQLYLARIAGIGAFERYVVVKVITPERSHDVMSIRMFLDEARLAASLHHNNIAPVIEVGAENNLHYFVMEYVHGQDLRAILARCGETGRRIPLEIALHIVASAAAGLHHAHDRKGPDGMPLKIVHRDVSPSNVMIDYDGAVKMVDFGIAKATERSAETQAGTIKGKFAYMSPEQCRGYELDRRSDIFALGIILYETTTQQRAFRADSDFETMQRIVQGKYRKPSTIHPDYPAGLQAIVERALQVDAKLRYQTAGELMEAIEKFAMSERLALSAMSLGRFMKELFGEVPEPWVTHRPTPAALATPREYTVSDAEAKALKSSAPISLDSDTEADMDLDAPTIPVPLTKDGRVDHAKLNQRQPAARTEPPAADPLGAVPTKVAAPGKTAKPIDDDTERQPNKRARASSAVAGDIAGEKHAKVSVPPPVAADKVVIAEEDRTDVEPPVAKKPALPIAPTPIGKPSPAQQSAAQPLPSIPRLGATASIPPPPSAKAALSSPPMSSAPPVAAPPVTPSASAAAAAGAKRPDTRQGGHTAPPPGSPPHLPTINAGHGPAGSPTSGTSPAAVVPPALSNLPTGAALVAVPSTDLARSSKLAIPVAAPAEPPPVILGASSDARSAPVAPVGSQTASHAAALRPATFSPQASSELAGQLTPSRRGLWIAIAIAAMGLLVVAYFATKKSSSRGALPTVVDAAVDAAGALPPVDAGGAGSFGGDAAVVNVVDAPPVVDTPVVEKPTTRTVRITSSPSGADVYIGKKRVGKTPYQMEAGANQRVTVRIEERGYRDATATVAAGETEQHVKLTKIERKPPPPKSDPCAPATWDAMRCKR